MCDLTCQESSSRVPVHGKASIGEQAGVGLFVGASKKMFHVQPSGFFESFMLP